MAILDDVKTQLEGDSATTALVGNRIYFSIAPVPVFNLIVLESSQQADTSLTKSSLDAMTVVITCAGKSFDDAKSVGDAVYVATNRKTFGSVASFNLQSRESSAVALNGDPNNIYYQAVLTFNSLYLNA